MSYEIIYGRQFVRTTRGIIPLMLIGPSNMTEGSGRHIRRIRGWKNLMGLTDEHNEESLFAVLTAGLETKVEDCRVAKIYSHWANPDRVRQFTKRAIRDAHSIEAIRETNPTQRLECCVRLYNRQRPVLQTEELKAEVTSTQELENWIDKARALYEANNGELVRICINFHGDERLRACITLDKDVPVVAKYMLHYLYSYTDCTFAVSNDRQRAIVFANLEEAKTKLPKIFFDKGGKIVGAAKALKPRPFVIRVTGGSRSGLYVYGVTSLRVDFFKIPQNARRFATESEALRWADKYLFGRLPADAVSEISVERI